MLETNNIMTQSRLVIIIIISYDREWKILNNLLWKPDRWHVILWIALNLERIIII